MLWQTGPARPHSDAEVEEDRGCDELRMSDPLLLQLHNCCYVSVHACVRACVRARTW
jgi:hypothetical protein